LRRAAFGAFRRHRYRAAYRVSYAPTYWVYAPVYGATIAGPSPSLPLYNRPSCPCY
jgi:hypothetical protein